MAFKFTDLTDEQRKTSKHLHATERHDSIAKLQDEEEWLDSGHNTGHPKEISSLKEGEKKEPKLVEKPKPESDASTEQD